MLKRRPESLKKRTNLNAELKSLTLPSPLRQLTLRNVTATTVHSDAVSALRVVHLLIDSCSIGSVQAHAISSSTYLDTLHVTRTTIGSVAEQAFSCATSDFVLESCNVTNTTHDAFNMPAARVRLSGNRITWLASGALRLREWSNVLVDANVFSTVERNAFYNIGAPKTSPSSGGGGGDGDGASSSFVISGNTVGDARAGAFLFSAQAVNIQLSDNRFRRACDCNLASWTDDLTQVRNSPVNALLLHGAHSGGATAEVLWLGSSLFNSSSCWLSALQAECLSVPQSFHDMRNYSSTVCADSALQMRCTAGAPGAVGVIDPPAADDGGDPRHAESATNSRLLVMLIVMVVAFAVALVVVPACFAVVRRSRAARKHSAGGSRRKMAEERITCSPLLAADKPLGSGVVSSGSISRLSVDEYRNYLDQLGPIYSEPLELPVAPAPVAVKLDIPPDIPAIPAEWTWCSKDSKSTMDRATQTAVVAPPPEESGESGAASVADEFSNDVFAALKFHVQPVYSQVKDCIDDPHSGAIHCDDNPYVYDMIQVVEPAVRKPEHIYCRPWNGATPINSSSGADPSLPPEKPTPARRSLPKWPPASADTTPATTPVASRWRNTCSADARRTTAEAPPKPQRTHALLATVCDDYSDPHDLHSDRTPEAADSFYSQLAQP